MEEKESVEELLRLGEMGVELGHWHQAQGYFDRALDQVPGHPRALLGKAKACQDPQKALHLVRRVLEVHPADGEARRMQRELEARAETLQDGSPEADRPPSPEYEGERPSSYPASPMEAAVGGENDRRPDLAQQMGRAAKRLLAVGADKETQRRQILGYVVAGLIVGGLIMAVLYPRILPLFDGEEIVGNLQRLSDDNRSGVEVAFPSRTAVSSPLRRAEQATALIIVPDPALWHVSRGSGSVISSEGLVITNYHLMTEKMGDVPVNEEGLAFVGLAKDAHEPPSAWYIACLLISDEKRDLAVLQILWDNEGQSIEGSSFTPMPLGDSGALELGQPLMGLGYPALGGETLTLTRGSMAGFYPFQDDLHLGKTDSELLPGSSGGAVLDDTGRLVGVITAAHTDQRTKGRLSYFILLNEAQDMIKKARTASCPDPEIDWMVDIFGELTK
ncbi:MAG: trypsin-like peptidase domain-containing protein [Anaerolineales bacterium]